MDVNVVDTGFFKLDGGAMFGVVPKKLWNRLNPADENNLCTWAMRCLLIDSGTRKILVDTGIGNKQDEKFKSHFQPRDQHLLQDSLLSFGLSSEDITDVLLTHLHFDHVGGAVTLSNDQLVPSFKNANYWVSKTHYDWAMNPNMREKASFLKENFVPLMDHGVLKFVNEEQGSEWLEDIDLYFVDGHTRSMFYLKIKSQGRVVYYCADLIPSSHHVGLPYIMSFDISPMKTLQEKENLLNMAIKENAILVFEHDPELEAATIEKSQSGRFLIRQKGTLTELLNPSDK